MNIAITSSNEKQSTIYNIGWFRLHEAAIKNEHERAFLNYKLLMYSYENKGFQLQIQGELHILFFEFEQATKAFKESFLIYFYNNDYIPALLIYLILKNHNLLNSKIIPNQEINKLLQFIKENKKEYVLFYDEI